MISESQHRSFSLFRNFSVFLLKSSTFPPVLNMLIILTITLIAKFSCGQTVKDGTALRFGQTTADYIQLPEGVMNSSTTKFSLCTWIRKRFSGSDYAFVLDNFNNIILASNGYYFYNSVAGSNLDVKFKLNRSLATWFHFCITWSNEDRRFRVYLDGHLMKTSGVTQRSELERGREMCLGNSAMYKSNRDAFGGDMFKLNIYNRVLTEEEIKNMAADMCSSEEEKLASNKILSWQDILQYRRSGNVSDMTVCINYRRKFQSSEAKLEECLKKTSSLEEKLTEAQGKLQNTKQKLEELKIARHKLQGKQGEVMTL